MLGTFSKTNLSQIQAAAAAAKSLQLCTTLCNPIDCSLLGSSVHGIFQARVLEWGAIAFSNGTTQSGVHGSVPSVSGVSSVGDKATCNWNLILYFLNQIIKVMCSACLFKFNFSSSSFCTVFYRGINPWWNEIFKIDLYHGIVAEYCLNLHFKGLLWLALLRTNMDENKENS